MFHIYIFWKEKQKVSNKWVILLSNKSQNGLKKSSEKLDSKSMARITVSIKDCNLYINEGIH